MILKGMHICFDPFPVLTTDRLVLRAITEEDTEDLFLLHSDERVVKYLDHGAFTMDDTIRYIRKSKIIIDSKWGINWAICLGGKIIGVSSFWRINATNYRAEFGYILHPDFQSKGYAREAALAIIVYGFNTLGLKSIEVNVNPENELCMKRLHKTNLPFVKEAHFKENWVHNGEFRDTVIYSLHNENFKL